MLELTGSTLHPFLASLFPEDYVGYAVELGAADGLYLSNTLAFEKKGWEVLCIEPNQDYYKKLEQNRKLTRPYACSYYNSFSGDLIVYKRHVVVAATGEPIVEPLSALGGLESQFKNHFCSDAIQTGVQPVIVRTLDACLEEVNFPRLDFLSLDVDGIEAEILDGLDVKRWGLKAAIVESPFMEYPINQYFLSRDYTLVARTHVDDIWVRV